MMKDLKGREYVFLIIITLFYAALAFWNLGSHHIPSTGWEREERDGEIFLDLGEDCQVAGIAWFLGNYENREFELSWKAQEGNWIQREKWRWRTSTNGARPRSALLLQPDTCACLH